MSAGRRFSHAADPVVALDGTTLGEASFPWSVCHARSRDLTVTLVQVVGWPPATMDGYLLPELYDEVDEADWVWPTRGGRMPSAWRPRAAARDQAADVLALSTDGRTGPARWILGSLAERVVRYWTRWLAAYSTFWRWGHEPRLVDVEVA